MFLLWPGGPCCNKVSVKRTDSVGTRRCLLSHVRNPKVSSPFMIPAKIQLPGKKPTIVSAFIDYSAATEFINHQFATSVGIELVPSNISHKVLALDGHPLHDSNLETTPINLLLSGNHRETITFIVHQTFLWFWVQHD